jgi:hypothetical protein
MTDNIITFTTVSNTEEMLHVRGVKIEQDAKEAEKVYTAFHQWLTWATLTRNY